MNKAFNRTIGGRVWAETFSFSDGKIVLLDRVILTQMPKPLKGSVRMGVICSKAVTLRG